MDTTESRTVMEPQTIKECLERSATQFPDAVALVYKRGGRWQNSTYGTLRERAWHVAQMLDELGVHSGERVALYRENSPEWFEIYHGIVGIGAVAVPIDTRLREQEVAHILHDCGVGVVFCSAHLCERVLGLDRKPRELHSVVMIDGGEQLPPAPEGIALHCYDTLRNAVSATARSAERAFDRRGPESASAASIIYTSGTTGRQKGAVLTHRNFVANVESILQAIDFHSDDNVLLVLPLHHSFAFTCTFVVPAYRHCRVTLVESLKTIQPDMAETSPTILLAVPLLLEKMLVRMQGAIDAKPAARWLCRCGLGRIVGRKVGRSLGGALRLIVSGGAPIAPATLRGWARLGFNIVEGYGITETGPVLTVNRPGAARPGTVGPPLDGVEIRIHQPNAEGIGEILARGENVMQGYYNDPEGTAEVLRDAWYHTGDLGRFDENGHLVISGRRKSLIVNREGKNIYPEEVERQVAASPYVRECLALGYRESDSDPGERVGLVVVPEQDVFDELEERGDERLGDEKIEQIVREDVRRRLEALSDYKRPRRIQIRFEEFEKTTTQKIKRYLYAIDTAARRRAATEAE